MSQQQSPWIDVAYGWSYGESGWNSGMDTNLLKFSVLFDGNVDGVVASLPPAVNGKAYYNTTDNRIYFSVGTTYYSTPTPKWYVVTEKLTGNAWQYNGSSIVQVDSASSIKSRLTSVELTLSTLGSAAFEDVNSFATQPELDVVAGQSQMYTDTLRQDIAASQGSELVGFQNKTVANALSSISNRILYAKDPIYGFVDSITADNTAAAVALLSAASDGDTIDFCGVTWRIYSTVYGIVSASATPATDRAIPVTSVPSLINKKGITLRNGGLYAANQGTASEKMYYPSTLYIKGCKDITFGPDLIMESRGESYGDADASLPLSVSDRQDFLACNGGHAVCMVRSSNIKGSITARLCGSTAVVYPSSCYNVKLSNSFSNPASLGYAAYCADEWCGSTVDTGFPEHTLYLENCVSHKETLNRREDGVAVGSAIYSSKNGTLSEDLGVKIYVLGGYYADAYGNSGPEGFQQGAAFASGSSHTEVTGARVSNCAYVATTASSSDYPGTVRLVGVHGDVGAGVLYNYKVSYSYQEADIIDCDINVTDTRFLGEVTESAYVINQAINIPVFVRINNCRFRGAKQVVWKPNKVNTLSYGGITIDGGEYETKGYLCNISGWGGSAAGTRQGVVIKGNARVYDTSNNVDTYIIAGNSADGGALLCYVWWDIRDCEIQTKNKRNIAGLSPSGSPTLIERAWYPERLESAYSTAVPQYPAQQSVTFLALNGIAGSFQRIIVRCNGRFPIKFPTALIGTGGLLVGIQSAVAPAAYNEATGNLEQEVYCSDIPAAGILVADSEYPLVG